VSEIDYGARAHLDYIERQLEALFPGRYVPFAAIQEYRNATGAGLAEAKKAVEAIR